MSTAQVYRLLDGLVARLLPPRCVLCRGPGQAPAFDLCVACEAALPRIERPCLRCALPLVPAADPALTGSDTCPACTVRGPAFTGCIAPFAYEFPLDELVTALKYRGALAHARVLGMLLARAVCTRGCGQGIDLVVPLPLHVSRLVERGFNQSHEIARFVARRYGFPLESRALRRCRPTAPQVGRTRDERQANVRDAFVAARHAVAGRHVALVDDVVTTGSTVEAAAVALLRAGARRVDVWCVARATG